MEEKSKTKFKEVVERMDLPTVEEIDKMLQIDNPDTPHRFKVLEFPKGIEVLRLMNELEISVKWRRVAKRFSLSFGIMWNIFLAFFMMAIWGGVGFAMILFMIPFFLAGGFLVLNMLGTLFNTSYISVNKKYLEISHQPIKILQKDVRIPIEAIHQVYTKKNKVGSVNNQPIYDFALWIILKKGKHMQIVKGFKTPEYARFVENQIETYAGIVDRKVRDEIKYTKK